MSDSYIGIDYGLGRSNVDTQTGIRYGVIGQNDCSQEALEDIMQRGEDVAFKEAKEEFLGFVVERVHNWFNNEAYLKINEKKQRARFKDILLQRLKNVAGASLAERVAKEVSESWGTTSDRNEILQEAEGAVDNHFGDHYESDNGLKDYRYEQDGYILTGCLDTDLFIIKSPFYTYAQFCSPCVPGAGNLGHPVDPGDGAPQSYCLGHDWFDNDKAPYRLWRVDDRVEILSTETQIPCINCNTTGRDTVQRLSEVRDAPVSKIIEEIKSGIIQVSDLRDDGTFHCWRCDGKKFLKIMAESEGKVDPNFQKSDEPKESS